MKLELTPTFTTVTLSRTNLMSLLDGLDEFREPTRDPRILKYRREDGVTHGVQVIAQEDAQHYA